MVYEYGEKPPKGYNKITTVKINVSNLCSFTAYYRDYCETYHNERVWYGALLLDCGYRELDIYTKPME